MGFKFPHILKDEARDECYEYFDKNIRELKKDSSGKVDPAAEGLQNNDVDAWNSPKSWYTFLGESYPLFILHWT